MEGCRICGHGGKQMSQQVQINYQQIAVQCNSICEVAEEQLKALEETLEKVKSNSESLLSEQTTKLERSIKAERNALVKEIEELCMLVKEQAKKGTIKTSNHDSRYAHRNDCVEAANRLQNSVNALASTKLVEFNGLLEMLLSKSISENYERLRGGASGVIIGDSVQRHLDDISDEALRQFTYLAYINDPTLSGDDLIAAGKSLMGQTFESRLESEKQKIRAELEAARVERGAIERVMKVGEGSPEEQLTAIRSAASDEIVGEKVRQKSLKIIMQAIQARGFVVDKKNIKIKRDTNEVVLVALKASGEKAEFRVFLDGKFIYDFRGYKGQACQKDIEPFMHDLEEVYGVKVTSQQTIWSNPDKISAMKYQSINTNKNKR